MHVGVMLYLQCLSDVFWFDSAVGFKIVCKPCVTSCSSASDAIEYSTALGVVFGGAHILCRF